MMPLFPNVPQCSCWKASVCATCEALRQLLDGFSGSTIISCAMKAERALPSSPFLFRQAVRFRAHLHSGGETLGELVGCQQEAEGHPDGLAETAITQARDPCASR
jgi:hypothetical protein